MPSSEVEIIQPADGRGETRNFLLTCTAIFAIAAALLSWRYEAVPSKVPELPKSLSNLATQISNALEEITLMHETGLLQAPYQLAELPLPALHGTAFTQLNEHCFTLFQGQYLFAVEVEAQQWTAHWAASEQALDCHAALNWHPLNR